MKLELRQVTKKFGDFLANDAIDLVVEPGQIHALLGENGAGKSTLMNVLYGLYGADGGEILLDGTPVRFSGPGDAMAAGIGMVHQHFMLVPVFTVAENVVLGHEPTGPFGMIKVDEARKIVKEISDKFGFDVDPDALVGDLPVGVQQRVEIIKALSRSAEILILDEPTAVLTPQETDELMDIMRQLKLSGTSIVFITHKLREVQEVADTIIVIRHGKVVGNALPTASQSELASLMVGRNVDLGVKDRADIDGEVVLEVVNLDLADEEGRILLENLCFTVSSGEILAIAGVQGNGQTELAEVLIGLRKPTAGSIVLHRHDEEGNRRSDDLAGKSVKKFLAAGIGFVPEDRGKDGIVHSFSIAENLVLDQISSPPFSSAGALNIRAIASNASDRVEEFDVRAGSSNAAVGTLSGGNQQKVVVARELSRDLSVLVASQPTRGVDIGSIEFIHSRIIQQRNKGTAVVIVSTELNEVTSLADRIAVMYDGHFVGIVPPDTERHVLGLMMAGVGYEDALAQAGHSPNPSEKAQGGDDV
ncbi:MAG: ABC transporter ATP-binding protein [Propionibacteriaceae bacterium]|jgi:simple sugar transport system ATP-binding protein|nr:ABC transporter ATP-binding protein [Propionibacteriaceae bacterium]